MREGVVVVGIIKGPWGSRGEVKIDAASDVPQRFAPGSLLFLGDAPIKVQWSSNHKKRLVVKLEGIDDRIQAEALMVQILHVPEEAVPPPPENHYYYFQILDMGVWTKEGELLGTVKEILNTGSNDVYVVRDQQRDVLVPAIEDVVVEVDVKNRRMVVDLPEGLL